MIDIIPGTSFKLSVHRAVFPTREVAHNDPQVTHPGSIVIEIIILVAGARSAVT